VASDTALEPYFARNHLEDKLLHYFFILRLARTLPAWEGFTRETVKHHSRA